MFRYFSLRSLALATVAGSVLLAGVLVLWSAPGTQTENFIVYLPQGSQILTAETINGSIYLPLIPLLNLSVQITGLREKQNSLELWIGDARLQFWSGHSNMRLNKEQFDLSHPVLRANGQWLVPASFLNIVEPRLISENVFYQPGTYRASVGGIHPVSFTVQLQNQPSGAKLVLRFTGRVDVRTASRNGKWIIFLNGPPVEPLEQTIKFNNSYIQELQFDDHDGHPKLILTPAAPGLDFYSQLAQNQELLTADLVNPQRTRQLASTEQPVAAQRHGPPGASASPLTVTENKKPSIAQPVFVLDAGHGGADAGARSRDGILEKNIAAALAQQVAAALWKTGKYRVILTRTGDSDPSFEQRTIMANTSNAAAFVTFHAGDLGDHSPLIAVYTYQSPSPAPAPGSLLFISWSAAQETESAPSQALAQALDQRFSQISGLTVRPLTQAPVRQLRSIHAPAAAVELGTLSPVEDAGVIDEPSFEDQVANAAAAALEQFAATQPHS